MENSTSTTILKDKNLVVQTYDAGAKLRKSAIQVKTYYQAPPIKNSKVLTFENMPSSLSKFVRLVNEDQLRKNGAWGFKCVLGNSKTDAASSTIETNSSSENLVDVKIAFDLLHFVTDNNGKLLPHVVHEVEKMNNIKNVNDVFVGSNKSNEIQYNIDLTEYYKISPNGKTEKHYLAVPKQLQMSTVDDNKLDGGIGARIFNWRKMYTKFNWSIFKQKKEMIPLLKKRKNRYVKGLKKMNIKSNKPIASCSKKHSSPMNNVLAKKICKKYSIRNIFKNYTGYIKKSNVKKNLPTKLQKYFNIIKRLYEEANDSKQLNIKETNPSVEVKRPLNAIINELAKVFHAHSIRNYFGFTLLHEIITISNSSNPVFTKRFLKMLISFKLSLGNVRDCRGYTILHLSCLLNQSQYIKISLDLKCNVNATDENGNTALHLAIIKRHFDWAFKLLDTIGNCFKLSTRNKKGDTVLHLAIKTQHIEIISRLINQFSPNLLEHIDSEGNNLMHVIVKQHNISLLHILLSTGQAKNLLITANNDGLVPLQLLFNCNSEKCKFNYLLSLMQ